MTRTGIRILTCLVLLSFPVDYQHFVGGIYLDSIANISIKSLMSKDYFVYKNTYFVTFFICWPIKDVVYLSTLFSSNGIRTTAKNLNNAEDLEEEISQMLLLTYSDSGIVVDHECPNGDLVLEKASAMENFNASYKWLIFSSTSCDTECNTSFNSTENNTSIDLTCNARVLESLASKNISVDVDLTVSSRKCFNNSTDNIVESAQSCETSVQPENDTQLCVKTCKPSDEEFALTLYDVYNVHYRLGGTIEVHESGQWNQHQQSGLQIYRKSFKYAERNDFRGITLRAVTVMSVEPGGRAEEVLRNPGYTFGVNGMTKYNSALLDLLMELYNFRLTYVITRVWGGINRDGSQDGMMGAFERREAEVSTGLRYLEERTPYTKFVMNTWELDVSFFFRVPADLDSGGLSGGRFTEPLSWSSWVATIACFLLLAALLAASMISHTIARHSAWKEEKTESPIVFALFSVFAAFCQQVLEAGPQPRKRETIASFKREDIPEVVFIDPRFFSGRLLCFMTFLFSLLIYNYYTSSVVSTLLSAPPPVVGGLQNLISGPLELVFEDIGYTRTLFENPNYSFQPTRKRLEKLMVSQKVKTKNRKTPVFADPWEGVKLVKQGGFAYQTELETANPLIADTFNQDEICEVRVLPMLQAPIFITTDKYSPFAEKWGVGIIRIMETGLASRSLKIFKTPSIQCSGGTGKPQPVPITRILPALLLLFWATVTSLILLGLEFLQQRWTHRDPVEKIL